MLNPPPLFAWVHLSDLQCGRLDAGEGWDRKLVLDALRDDLADAATRGCPKLDAILVTGDVASNGAVEHYSEAKAWLTKIAKTVGVAEGSIHVVPGNHDVQRTLPDRSVGQLIKLLRSDPDESLDESLQHDRTRLEQRFAAYLSFAASLAPTSGHLFWTHRFEAVGGLRVRLVGMNTALLSADETDKSKLRLGKAQLHAALAEKQEDELIIVLSHHPFRGGWLVDESEADAHTMSRATTATTLPRSFAAQTAASQSASGRVAGRRKTRRSAVMSTIRSMGDNTPNIHFAFGS